MKMKFSLLIANYNNGKYFEQCYKSIIAQTYKKWEVIIVDDCSTDDSVARISALIKDDPRFKLFCNKQNRGCGFTKRETLKYATGKICGFLDPDDALAANALQSSAAAYREKGIVATYSKVTFCDSRLQPLYNFEKVKQIVNSREFFNCPIQMHHFFSFKKSTYAKTEGINPALKSAVDQDLYLKILEQGEVKFISENLYFYRTHSAGISQFESKKTAKENFARVIFESMQRRGITELNGKPVPALFPGKREIFALLNYQNSRWYRLKLKLHLLRRHCAELRNKF